MSLAVPLVRLSISLQMYIKKMTPEASLAHYFQKNTVSEITAGNSF